MEQNQTFRPNLRQIFSRNTLWSIGAATLACSIFALILSITVAEPDLWGHLRFGLDTLQGGKIIQVDPYSYLTTGQRWINHEWLSEVLFALAWKAGGAFGLILLKMTVGFLIVASLYWYLRSLKLRHFQATILILLLGIPLLFPYFNVVRPHIFTFLFFALLLLFIRQAEIGKYRWLWAAPPLLILWVNLHGGFLAGLGLLCLWAALHFAFHRHAWMHFIPPILASIATAMINPYSMDLLPFLLRTATVPRPEITDWQPLRLLSIYGLLYLLVLLASVYWLALSSKPRRPILLILFGITALLPWMAVRHLPLFYIAVLVLISEHAGSTWEKAKPLKQETHPLSLWIAGLPFVFAAVLFILGSTQNFHRIHVNVDDLPITAVALLKQSGASGNLATEFDWGEYIIWNLGPKIKVSVDGRRETIYSTDIYQKNLNFLFGKNDWDALLKQHWTDLALVRKNEPVTNLLKLTPGWLMVYEDASSALFVNQDSALLGPLRQALADFTPPKAIGYFPSAEEIPNP